MAKTFRATAKKSPVAKRARKSILQSGAPIISRENDTRANGFLHLQRTLGNQAVQRIAHQAEEPEEEEEQTIQAKSSTGKPGSVAPAIAEQIQALRGGGEPLPQPARAFFEPRFGHDFSQVRVHTDPGTSQLARAVNARAFTVGQDVMFGAGEYAPYSAEGRKLLAHELTHVVQQGASRPGQVGINENATGGQTQQAAPEAGAIHHAPQVSPAAPAIQRRVQVLDDPLPPGFVGPPARTGADFIRTALESFTDLHLSYSGNFLQVDAATRAAVLRERRERPTRAAVRARLFIIPGVSRAHASAALKLAQVIIDRRAAARIQPVFGEPLLMGAFPAAGGGGIQRIDINDIRQWQLLTTPANEPLLRIIAWLRGFLGLAAAARPAAPLRTDTAGSIIYHEVIESFRAAVAGAGTLFPAPHRAAITTANVALRAMGNLEFLHCPSPLLPATGGEIRIRTFWRRRRPAGREDRYAQDLFLSAPPNQALVWVDPPVLVHANVPTGEPCPP